MSRLRALFARIRGLFGRSASDRDLADEFAAHLEMAAAEYERRGLEPAEARRRARLDAGSLEVATEAYRDQRGLPKLDAIMNDLRFSLRSLRRTPGFTAVAVLTLALGIGANTAVFSVVDGVLLKPLPYPHPTQLVTLPQASPVVPSGLGLGPSEYFVDRDQNHVFQDIGLYQTDAVTMTGTGRPERLSALDVTRSLLPTLGVQPAIGRWFDAKDDSPGASQTAVLMYSYWQSRFGGDPKVIGRRIVLDGKTSEIIGVMPPRFRFPELQQPDLILPLQLDRNHTYLGEFHYTGIARLKPGVSIEQANADLARLLPTVLRSFPPPPGYDVGLFTRLRLRPDTRPLDQQVVGNVSTLLWVLMGGIGMVLLIACANVANLLLVRADGRQQELAVRAALGASRGRIAARLLTESLLIGLAGSALGLVLADAGVRLLVLMAPSGLPRLNEIGIDVPVLLFALVAGVLASLLFGSVPVWEYARTAIGARLREGGRSPSQSLRRHRTRNALVTLQVALAFILLTSSGLMIRTFVALVHVNSGVMRPADLQTFRISIEPGQRPHASLVLQTERAIASKLGAIPGVTSVAFASSIPMAGHPYRDAIWVRDRTHAAGQVPPVRRFVFASPDYFQVMGTPLVAGRTFTWSETLDKRPFALVSAAFAREQWGSPAAAIGKRIRASSTDKWRQVIGVVGDVRYDGMDKPPCSCVYFPLYNTDLDSNPVLVANDVAFVIRTRRAGSQALLAEVRRAVWSVDAGLPVMSVHTMAYFEAQSTARTSFTLVMLGIAGGMALLLAMIGLYGVVAYAISRRTREIGVRIALGAQRGDTLRLVAGQSATLVLSGIALGVAGSVAVARVMTGLLYGVGATDPPTMAAVAIVLGLVALMASLIPARRAMRVDPVVALRHE